MKWKQVAAAALITGMVAITGCSSNLPETNQGNRNGQRVADAVNRREDTYRTTSNRLGMTENNYGYNNGRYAKERSTDGILGRTTRGIRRAADNVTGAVRGTGGSTYRYHKNTHGRYNNYNGTPRHYTQNGNYKRSFNRSLNLGRPQGRIGNTYRYGNHPAYAYGINHATPELGYDMGVSVTQQAAVSNAIAPNRAINTSNTSNRAVPTRNVKNTTEKTETKVIDTKRSAKQDKTKAHNTPAAERTTRGTAPKLTIDHTKVGPRSYPASVTVPFQVAPEITLNHRAHSRAANPANKRHTMSLNEKRVSKVPKPERTVPVFDSDDSTAFFRKKVEPTQPQPNVPVQPVSMDYELNNDFGYDDYSGSIIHSANIILENLQQNTTPNPTPSPAPTPVPSRSLPTQRAMK